jgi:hypothetical protein
MYHGTLAKCQCLSHSEPQAKDFHTGWKASAADKILVFFWVCITESTVSALTIIVNVAVLVQRTMYQGTLTSLSIGICCQMPSSGISADTA